MTEQILVHMNVVRPVGPYKLSDPNPSYFFQQFPKIAARAREFDGLLWHTHAARLPDGRYLSLQEFMTFESQQPESNPDVMTMAGWRDAASIYRFARRDDLHRDGAKTLHDWVDRSAGATSVLFWVAKGTRVAFEQAWERLQHLRREGATPHAFSLQRRFDPPQG